MSKLPKPTSSGPKIPQPKIRVPPTVRNRLVPSVSTINLATSISGPKVHVPPANLLRRRSKSVSDLRSVKPFVKPFPPVKTTVKRPADKEQSDAPKPKMVKKIPDWDYKGKFQYLQEKHNNLIEIHKETKKKISEYETLKQQYNDLEAEKELLLKTQQKLSSERDELNACYQDLLEKERTNLDTIKRLEKELEVLKASHETLSKLHEQLKSDNAGTLLQNNKLMINNATLTEERDAANKKITELQQTVEQLKEHLHKGYEDRRHLHNCVQDLKGTIRVFCRIRPPINDEEEDRLQCYLSMPDDATLEIRRNKLSLKELPKNTPDNRITGAVFNFDKVFCHDSTQEEVFEDLAQLVQSALDGFNICVFAYGQTGSGKTYTMQGLEEPERLGMIPRTVDLIFKKIQELNEAGWQYTVQASFLEIYNEIVRDLLNLNSAQKLDIHFNEGKGTTVTNLTIQPVRSATELKKYIVLAHRNRATEATNFNEHSSRSHAVTKIYLQGTYKSRNTVYTGSISLVDLAGSESAKTASCDERLSETKNINKSLATLGDVMHALHNKNKHIPYRNSKLTYLLQSSLGGNSKTLMVVNIAPFEECFNESINSLRFASKVKEVKISAKRNKMFAPPPPP